MLNNNSFRGITFPLCFSLLLCFFFMPFLAAQEKYPDFHVYNTQNDLLTNSVNCFLQDKNGYLWIGTSEGINIFNGTTMRSLTTKDGLNSGFIVELLESKKNTDVIYAATRNGLCKISNGQVTSYYPGPKKIPGEVSSFTEDPEGVLWCGTPDGLLRFSDGNFQVAVPFEKLGFIYSLSYESNNRSLLVSADKGNYLFSLQTGELKQIGQVIPEERLGRDWITSFVRSKAGDVYAIGRNGSLHQLKNGKLEKISDLKIRDVFAAAVDHKDQIWIASSFGLFRVVIKNGAITQEQFTEGNGLPERDLRHVYCDREGNVWCATFNSGIVKLAENFSFAFRFPDSGGIFRTDAQGHVWYNTSKGIWEFYRDAENSWQRSYHEIFSRSENQYLFHFRFARDGRLWLSSGYMDMSGNVTAFQVEYRQYAPSVLKPTNISISPKTNFPLPGWMNLYFDAKDRLWYSIVGDGVAVVDVSGEPRLLKIYKNKDGLADLNARAMFEDKDHNMWLGGWSTGISRIAHADKLSNDITHYTIQDGIADNAIRSIAQDGRGHILFGGRFGGLTIFDGTHFSIHSRANDLPGDQIWSIVHLDQKRILLGLQSGVVMAEVHGAEGYSFHLMKDIPVNQVHDLLVIGDGSLFCALHSGIAIYPARFSGKHSQPLPIRISGLDANGKNIPLQPDISLSYNQNSLAVHFEIVSLSLPVLSYEYKLHASDKQWTPVGSDNVLMLPSLRPGKYTILIHAIYPGGHEVSTVASLELEIQPPFWQSWYFILLTLLLAAGLGSYVFIRRVDSLKSKQNELLALIREKDAAQNELQESEALFRIITGGVSDLIAILDLDGNRLYSSDSYGQLFGDVTQLKGRSSFSEIHPDDRNYIRDIFYETITTGIGRRAEYRFVLTDGTYRYIESQGNLITDADGTPSKVIVVSRDITERRNQEAELASMYALLEKKVEERTAELSQVNDNLHTEIRERQRKEEEEKRRLEAMINHRNILLELARLDKSMLSAAMREILRTVCNTIGGDRAGYWQLDRRDAQVVCQFLYIAADEQLDDAAVGIRLPATFPGIAGTYTEYLTLLKENRPLISYAVQDDEKCGYLETYLKPRKISALVDVPVWFERKIAGVLGIEFTGTPRRLSLEEENFLSAVATMITLTFESANRFIAEESLRHSEEQYRLLVENASEGIIVAQDGMIRYVNPRTVEVTGYSVEELLAAPFTEFIYPEDRARVIANYMQRLQGEETLNLYTFRTVKKTGEIIVIEINAVLIEWQGRRATLNFITDVTERAKVEEEMQRSLVRERELSILRSRFISMASHEFRTPLTTILTSSEILLKFGDQLTGEKRISNILRIQENVKHMNRLLNDVLIIGKSDEGKIELNPEPVDIVQFTGDAVEELLHAVAEKYPHRIHFQSECKNKIVPLDAKLMKQILENLLLNALKYSPNKLDVWLSVKSDDKEVQFVIRDEGIGIPESDVPLLFEPFYRAGNTQSIPGTGLGLVVVKRAVDLHRGTMTVVSTEGKGTTFTIIIPIV